MSCGCVERDGVVVAPCGAHVAWLRARIRREIMGYVADMLRDVHPLREGDEGHFLCATFPASGAIHSVHGVLSPGSFEDFDARILIPASAHLVKYSNSGANMPAPTGGEPANY